MKLHKNLYAKLIIRKHNDAIWVHKVHYGKLLFRFSQNYFESPASNSIGWNRTKFCIKDDIDIIFAGIACQRTLQSQIFPELLGVM